MIADIDCLEKGLKGTFVLKGLELGPWSISPMHIGYSLEGNEANEL